MNNIVVVAKVSRPTGLQVIVRDCFMFTYDVAKKTVSFKFDPSMDFAEETSGCFVLYQNGNLILDVDLDA